MWSKYIYIYIYISLPSSIQTCHSIIMLVRDTDLFSIWANVNAERCLQLLKRWIMAADTDQCFSLSPHLQSRGCVRIGSVWLPCHACDNIKGTHRELLLLSVAALLCSLYARWPEPKGSRSEDSEPGVSPHVWRPQGFSNHRKNTRKINLSNGPFYTKLKTEIWLEVLQLA